ncbi:unnamed protein product, partial [Closterium sp. NIES-54]
MPASELPFRASNSMDLQQTPSQLTCHPTDIIFRLRLLTRRRPCAVGHLAGRPQPSTLHASRVFEGLAADLAEVASRREQVAARARGIESVVGRIEERILKDSHPLALAYTPGVRWRAHVPTAQQVLLSADRPLVIVTAYQNAAPAPPLKRLHRLLPSPAGDLAEGENGGCETREVREAGSSDWRACDDAERGGEEAAGEGSDGAGGIEGGDSRAARATEILLQL